MIKTTLTLVCAVFALTFATNVNAQGCGGSYAMGSAVSYGGCGNYGSYGVTGYNDCGRDYTNNQAASLWAGYCTDTCDTGSGCGLFSRLKNRGGCGLGGGGCGTGCGNGGSCFGWPSGGCGTGCGIGGGCGSGCGTSGRLFGNRGCGGGCKLFSGGLGLGNFGGIGHLAGGKCRSGCGLFSKCKSRSGGLFGGCGCGLFSKLKGRRNNDGCGCGVSACDQCGCGNNGQYFTYAVGAEYGTAGMQSVVSGQLTGACCGGSVYDGSMMAQPVMQGAASPVVEHGVAAPVPSDHSDADNAITVDQN